MELFILGIIFIVIIYITVNSIGRKKFITNYIFPETLDKKIKETYPHLSHEDLECVEKGLRQYFIICHKAGGKMVAMPSRVVDVAWHEFILHTRAYHHFCNAGFGQYLHHSPFSKTTSTEEITDGHKRAWHYSCIIEDINLKRPSQLPLLFGIDFQLKITDGNIFSLGNMSQIKLKESINIEGLGGCASDAGGCGGGCGGCGGA
jgi:hypothetical protein